MPDLFRTWAEIDAAALRHNLSVARDLAGPGRDLMAIVKADAYGHGLDEVASVLAGDVSTFGVACVQEGLRVRAVAPGRIFLLGPALPHERPIAVKNDFTVTVSTGEEIRAFAAFGKPLKVHLAVDTGMGRIGCRPEEAPALAAQIQACLELQLEGFYTHFPSADEDEHFTRSQIAGIDTLLRHLPSFPQVHLSNSAGLMAFGLEQPFANLARPGLMLYGISPIARLQPKLRPVMSLKTRVTLTRTLPAGHGVSYGRTFLTSRPTQVATLAAGYGDGYPRHLSGHGADVLIGGIRCPLLGRVTMDQIMVDVSHLDPPPEPGSEAVLIGNQGSESILASELAQKAGTIPWEILTGITRRVRRVYLHE